MTVKLQSGKWYLLKLFKIEVSPNKNTPSVKIDFTHAGGDRFTDFFYLTDKAITRFACLASRAGCEIEVKTADDARDIRVQAAILGKNVWALVKEDDRSAGLKTDGWHFRPESDPPEDGPDTFVDYKKQDEEDRAMDGL